MAKKVAKKTLKSAPGSRESIDSKQRRCREVTAILRAAYPDAKCSLDYRNAFELLCATILSAQCTDERVNMVTPALFAKYPDARAMAKAKVADVEKLVQSTGFYKNKAKALVESSKLMVERHQARVPGTLEELTSLRGVGRKTANVVLGNAFETPGFVVDTHIGRLSRRMGFTTELDPVKVEHEMMQIVPREDWTEFGHLLIAHGRARCEARKPDCLGCEVRALCPRVGVTASTARPARGLSVVSGKRLREQY